MIYTIHRPLRVMVNKTEDTIEVIDGGSMETDNYDLDIIAVKTTKRIRR